MAYYVIRNLFVTTLTLIAQITISTREDTLTGLLKEMRKSTRNTIKSCMKDTIISTPKNIDTFRDID